MMVNYDHMLMLYKTNVENMLARRRIRCERSSSMPSLKSPVFVVTNCNKPYDNKECQEEYAEAEPSQEMNQLRHLIAEQAEAMKRLESHSQQFVSQQQEEYAHKQHTQFQQFDGVLRDLRQASSASQPSLCRSIYSTLVQHRLRRRQSMRWRRLLTGADQPFQVGDSLTKTVPKARIIPNKVVMNTSGAQYDRRKQATSNELQAFLKIAWKEPTPEFRARYFAAKKKVVMQLLVFSLKPMTAKKKAQGLIGDEYENARICLQGQNHEGFQVQNSTANADAHLLRLFLAAQVNPKHVLASFEMSAMHLSMPNYPRM